MSQSCVQFLKDFDRLQSPSSQFQRLRHKQTFEPYLLREVRLSSLPLLKSKVRMLEQHSNTQHQYILPLCTYFVQESEPPFVTIIYKAGLHTLSEEVEARKIQQKHFKQNEIWAILYGIVSSMSYVQKLGNPCGDIGMDYIYLTESGKAKIINPSYVEVLTDIQPQKYYSPQQVAVVTGSEEDFAVYKTNVFTVALCVLNCCLLDGVYDYIDFQKGFIDFDYLQQLLQQTSQLYSEDLVRLLVDMLDQQVESRPDFLQLEEYMSNICTLEGQGQIVTLTVPIDMQNLNDQSVSMDFPDQASVPDIGEGIQQEEKQIRLPKLQLNPLQISLSNSSSNDIKNKARAFGLDQIKNVKIADSLSYSGMELEPYQTMQTPYAIPNHQQAVWNPNLQVLNTSSFDCKQNYNLEGQNSFKIDNMSATLPYNVRHLDHQHLATYSYISPTNYCTIEIPKTDESGLFTSPELLSFIKGETRNLNNENSNPN